MRSKNFIINGLLVLFVLILVIFSIRNDFPGKVIDKDSAVKVTGLPVFSGGGSAYGAGSYGSGAYSGRGQPEPACSTDAGCNDNNPCTDDRCVAGQCQNANDDTNSCNDNLFCTTNDRCNSGQCVGDARVCSDNLGYTLDSCNEQSGSCISRNIRPDISRFSLELTTDITRIADLSNVRDFRVGVLQKGRIEFIDQVLDLRDLNLSSLILFGTGYITLDSNRLPRLNVPSILTLYNINYQNPIITKNRETCTECNILSYENGELRFKVPHWTIYSVEDSSYCGDIVCDSNESCSTCSADCGSCPRNDSGGGNGSGGGGAACNPIWKCSYWRICNGGKQTRECYDERACSNPATGPQTVQSCFCVEEWNCGEWSSCSNGAQTRTCADKNNCGTSDFKPQEQKSCNATKQDSCLDNIKNQGETGIDCGGPCELCIEQPTKAKEEKALKDDGLGKLFILLIINGVILILVVSFLLVLLHRKYKRRIETAQIKTLLKEMMPMTSTTQRIPGISRIDPGLLKIEDAIRKRKEIEREKRSKLFEKFESDKKQQAEYSKKPQNKVIPDFGGDREYIERLRNIAKRK